MARQGQRRRAWYLAVLAGLVVWPGGAAAGEPEGTLPFGLMGHVSVGYEGNHWAVNRDESDDSAVDYRTEGLQAARIEGVLGFGSKPLLTARYERPLENTPEQREMLETNGSTDSGLEKFTGGIRLDPVVEFLIPEGNLLKTALRKVLSVRFRHTRALFFGEARATADAEYLPSDAIVDNVNNTVAGSIPVRAGDKLSFKTTFTENEISIPVLTFGLPISVSGDVGSRLRLARHDIRLGYYRSQWERPSDNVNLRIAGRPVIYEAEYDVEGILLSVETVDSGSPGVNLDFYFKWGTKAELSTAIDWDEAFGPGNDDVDVDSVEIGVSLWYNWYFSTDRDKGWFATIGGDYAKRAVNVDLENDDGRGNVETSRLVHDTDELYKFYLTGSYRF